VRKEKENKGGAGKGLLPKIEESVGRKNASFASSNASFVQGKTVKEILGGINLKLSAQKKHGNKIMLSSLNSV
jgi:hypothetical protein